MAKVTEINKEFNKPLCVYGVTDNVSGRLIKQEMMPWLTKYYNVIEVLHDGSLFELPALMEARRVSLLYNQPVLYIHTRGAYNVYRTTVPTRRMWREEFGNQWQKYQQLVDDQRPTIACPFYDGEHRYNGFVANATAWAMTELKPTADRMEYEHLWRGKEVRMIGTLVQSEEVCIKQIRQYLYRNFE